MIGLEPHGALATVMCSATTRVGRPHERVSVSTRICRPKSVEPWCSMSALMSGAPPKPTAATAAPATSTIPAKPSARNLRNRIHPPAGRLRRDRVRRNTSLTVSLPSLHLPRKNRNAGNAIKPFIDSRRSCSSGSLPLASGSRGWSAAMRPLDLPVFSILSLLAISGCQREYAAPRHPLPDGAHAAQHHGRLNHGTRHPLGSQRPSAAQANQRRDASSRDRARIGESTAVIAAVTRQASAMAWRPRHHMNEERRRRCGASGLNLLTRDAPAAQRGLKDPTLQITLPLPR